MNIRLLFSYIHYYITAQTKHDIHSPFFFKLLTDIIEDKTPFYVYNDFELLRKRLRTDKKEITVNDFGAGSKVMKSSNRTIASIAKYATKEAKYSQLLFRLVHYFKPKTILELGTSLGFSTLHLAYPDKNAQIITIEGCQNTRVEAKQLFQKFQLTNIKSIVGKFQDVLPKVLEENKKLDFVFFDGDHREEATKNYFEMCLPNIHNDTVFVFDDIYWSKGMKNAWNYIKKHPEVKATIDLFQFGMVFFRKELTNQHFKIRY